MGAGVGAVGGGLGSTLGGVSLVRSRIGWALWSSRVWPCGLSAALLPLSGSCLAVPDHPDLCPPVVPQVAEPVLDCALTPDPVARVVIAEGLLDLRASCRIPGTPQVEAVLVAGRRIMRMPGQVGWW